ncbi:MAG: SusF/SusE family outer membrane protein [Prevotellaceae bacterium]|nr:SusF/SusE family outer membrane protein [Prevotellaceae bacterium]
MKKILYTLGLALLFTGCTDDYTDWANPMQNGDEGTKTIAMSVSTAPAIDFSNVTTEKVKLFSTAITAEDETTSTYEVVLYNADKSASVTIEADDSCYVDATELETAVKSLYGRRPTAREIAADVTGYVKVNGQALKATGSTTATVTLDAPFIDEAYYLYGNVNSWSTTDQSYKLENGGGDVYDDSEFTITVTAPTDANGDRIDFEFKIAPATAYTSSDFENAGIIASPNADGDEATSGTFSRENGGYFKQPKDDGAKLYVLSFDMYEGTYSIQALSFDEYIWMAGDANGWNQVDPLSSPNFDGVYTGYMYLNQNGFKFCTQQDWNGTNYGEGFSTAGDAANITMTEPEGYYKVVVDIPNTTLTLTAISTIGIIGDATANGWDASEPMTYDRTNRCWEITTTVTDGTFKFRANDDWDINWGGTIDNLTSGGDNINITAGTYTIKFYPNCEGKAYAEITAASASSAKRK